jgi:hypothetical protein
MSEGEARMPNMISVDSTNIESVSYDPASLKFHVRFAESGKTYVFYGVEEERFQKFMEADSKGEYLNNEIKTHYRYERYDPDSEPIRGIDT